MVKKILIMGMVCLGLLTGCVKMNKFYIENKETESEIESESQTSPNMDPGPQTWYINIGVPEELRATIELYSKNYVNTELSAEYKQLVTVSFETVEPNTIVEDMDERLSEDSSFCDIYFCYVEQFAEIEEIGGCIYSVQTEYMDKNGKILSIGLLPQASVVEQEVKKDMIDYFKECLGYDEEPLFPENE